MSEADPLSMPLEQLYEELSATDAGLPQDEAAARLERYGPNAIEQKKRSPVLKFLSYFWGPIPWMIEVAAILSAILRDWTDMSIVLALLVVNAVVGFWEEYQADTTVEALKEKLALEARARRDGNWKKLPARELVPGDVVLLRLGDVVPADARLIEGAPLSVDQSALTGESLPVDVDEGGVLYSGSVVEQGEAQALVVATGGESYFGRTAKLVDTTRSMSHFQKTILRIGDYLIVIALALVLVILLASIFRGEDFLTTVQFALILVVAAIPVALPTILSVTMAVGARKLAARQAIVTHLSSIEELAGIDVLCSDKTGTLTRNSLTVGDPWLAEATDANEIIAAAALASRGDDPDPIDAAVLEAAGEGKGQDVTVSDFVPFDPVHKRTEATVHEGGHAWRVSKGAPQVIIELASLSGEAREAAEQAVDDFAGRGFRSLGVARSDEGDAWTFLGILPLFDPPRDDSAATIATAGEMGIAVKMVTGDQQAIAKETARRLEMGANILHAKGVLDQRVDATLEDTVEEADGFAEVFPEHKHHIVDLLQKRGHFVGMTGDGVNDAPALKKADVGIAVSGATDAARSAADIVLTAPGLSVIVDAVKEARRIFKRMTTYATYRITETIRILLFMTLAILLFQFYPLTAVMIVLLAILNDGAILSIAFDRARYRMVPERWQLDEVLTVATVLGVMGVIETFGLFYIAERIYHIDRATIQSLMYLKLSVSGHLTVFVVRTRGPVWKSRPSAILFLAVLSTQVLATIITVFGVFMPPLGWVWAGAVWIYALVWFLIEDLVKQGTYRILGEGALGARLRDRA